MQNVLSGYSHEVQQPERSSAAYADHVQLDISPTIFSPCPVRDESITAGALLDKPAHRERSDAPERGSDRID